MVGRSGLLIATEKLALTGVEMAKNPMPERRVLGKREMMNLVLATIRALEGADLEDELQELRGRVCP